MSVQYPREGRSMRVRAVRPPDRLSPAQGGHLVRVTADPVMVQVQPRGRGVGRRAVVPGPVAAGPAEQHGRCARLALRVPAAVDRLRPLRRRVEHWALAHDVDGDDLTDLQLALGEAVSNAMEHAYCGTAAATTDTTATVDVELRVRATGPGREVVVRVTDRGRWKPATSRPTHRGRGIAMIDGLSVGMRVTSNRSGTEVAFTVPLDDA